MKTASSRTLALFRMGYSALGILFALQHRSLTPLFGVAHEGLFLASLWAWVALAALLLVGLGHRVTAVAHFLAVDAVRMQLPGYSFDLAFYHTAAFWICFSDLTARWSLDANCWRAARDRVAGWPCIMLGCNLGFWLLSAGLCKLVDPLWYQGCGLYYVLLQPWIRSQSSGFLLDQTELLTVANWGVIVLETIWLPLYLWPRTRPLALALSAGSFVALIWPLRLDPIGPLGLLWCLFIAAPLIGSATAEPLTRFARAICALGWLGMSGVFLILHWPLFNHAIAGLCPYLDGDQIVVERPGVSAEPAPPLSFPGLGPLYFVNQHTTLVCRNGVFGTENCTGWYGYRVQVHTSHGTLEPLDVFGEDLFGRDDCLGPLTPRYLEAEAFYLSRLCRAHGYGHPTGPWHAHLQGLCRLAAARSGVPSHQITGFTILVHAILVPPAPSGNVEPWADARWMTLCTLDQQAGAITFEPIPKYPLVLPSNPAWRIVLYP